MMEVQDIIKEFHNLQGVLLREKNKSFHSLLRKVEDSGSASVLQNIKELVPVTYLEETFKVEFLIYFKKSEDLLNVLTSGDEIRSCKIVRQDWFIKDLLKKFSSSELIVKLFSKLSLSIRLKILKRLVINIKDENRIDELFETLHRTYGLKIALVLLPGCSNEKIKDHLKKNIPSLSASQLKLLFNKDKTIIATYFEEMEKNGENLDDYKWKSFFNYMGRMDPSFYFEIADKYKLYKRKLGRKSTKKFIDMEREKVLNKPEDYSRSLRSDALVRKLGKDFPKFYEKSLPSSIHDFRYCHVKNLIRYYTKNKRYELYCNAFESRYNKSLRIISNIWIKD
ncbi:hypothetical protein HHI36_009443 [Cryptolaemus montrouzieri]|uniref:Uncharacterized protein n=1 Tax=Cryptolaemus montrouzieri TaxID=559131 RepID=A0ABD2MFV6_9CUCU